MHSAAVMVDSMAGSDLIMAFRVSLNLLERVGEHLYQKNLSVGAVAGSAGSETPFCLSANGPSAAASCEGSPQSTDGAMETNSLFLTSSTPGRTLQKSNKRKAARHSIVPTVSTEAKFSDAGSLQPYAEIDEIQVRFF